MTKKESTPKKSKFKTVVQSLPFHNFEEDHQLVAMYKDTVTLGSEGEVYTAHIMQDVETGEEVYIGNPFGISKAIEAAKEKYDTLDGIVFEINFIGKTTVKGKPFNQFKIGVCTIDEYEAE